MRTSQITTCNSNPDIQDLLNRVDCTILDLSYNRMQNLQYNTELHYDEELYRDLLQYKKVLTKKLYNQSYLVDFIDIQDIIRRVKELAYKLGLCRHCIPAAPIGGTTTTTSTSSTSTSSTSSTSTSSTSSSTTSSTTTTTTTRLTTTTSSTSTTSTTSTTTSSTTSTTTSSTTTTTTTVGVGGMIAAPSAMAASDIYDNRLSVSWTAAPQATNYILERATDAGYTINLTQVYSGSQQVYDDVVITPNTSYFYRVKAQAAGFIDSPFRTLATKSLFRPISGGFRFASALDAATIANANVGDFIIDGANAGGGIIATSIALSAGGKVLIQGGLYDYVFLDLTSAAGVAGNPVIVTNFNGKVRGKLDIANAQHVKITGRYDPVAKTGDANYRGWDTNPAVLTGSFGFHAKMRYNDTQDLAFHLSGNLTVDTEIEYLEIGEGSYSGMTIKNDNGSIDMNDIKIHDCYIHDTGGEGLYLGSTQPDPQMQFNGLRVYNNLFVRNGLNSIQTGQLKDDCQIFNNTIICGAFQWSNNFMRYQDQTLQQSSRRSGFQVYNNLVIGGGESYINYFMTPLTGLPLVSTPTVFNNNAFLYLRGTYGGYMNANGDNKSQVNFTGNYFGKRNLTYRVVYQIPNALGTSELVIEAYASAVTIRASGNFSDKPNPAGFVIKTGDAASSTIIDDGTNQSSVSMAHPQFKNFMDLPFGYDFATIEYWTALIEPTWNNASVVASPPINFNQPRVYGLNDLVFYYGRVYKSLHINNSGNQPTGFSDAHWQVQVYPTGSVKTTDDCRLYTSDFYAQKNIGMLRQFNGTGTTTTTTSTTTTSTTTGSTSSTSSTTTTTTTVAGTSKFIDINLYGGVNPTTLAGWNNWDITLGGFAPTITNPLYRDGTASAYILNFNDHLLAFDNGAGYGTLLDTSIMRYAGYKNGFPVGSMQFILQNMNTSKLYDFEFICSANITGRETRITMGNPTYQFSTNPTVKTVVVDNQETLTIKFTNVALTSDYVAMLVDSSNNAAYFINAIRITEKSAS